MTAEEKYIFNLTLYHYDLEIETDIVVGIQTPIELNQKNQ